MADEITLEQDIEELLGWAQTADRDIRDMEPRFEASPAEPKDEEEEGSEEGDDED